MAGLVFASHDSAVVLAVVAYGLLLALVTRIWLLVLSAREGWWFFVVFFVPLGGLLFVVVKRQGLWQWLLWSIGLCLTVPATSIEEERHPTPALLEVSVAQGPAPTPD